MDNIVSPDQFDSSNKTAQHLGDGWLMCDCGKKHWGLNGAAGVIIAKFNRAKQIDKILLQKRADWTSAPGCWGIPGGAIADEESSLKSALREVREEIGLELDLDSIIGSFNEDHGNWKFTTFYSYVEDESIIDDIVLGDESVDCKWFTFSEISQLNLIKSFQFSLPSIKYDFEKKYKSLLK
jgi:septum formation protein